MTSFGGVTRSLNPGLQQRQLNPSFPQSERNDSSWDEGSGKVELQSDVLRENEYNGSSLELLGLDGEVSSAQLMGVSDFVRSRVIQELSANNLGFTTEAGQRLEHVAFDNQWDAPAEQYDQERIAETFETANNIARTTRRFNDESNGKNRLEEKGITSNVWNSLGHGLGKLKAGVESDLNYPFHFLNVVMRYNDAGLIGAGILLLILSSLISTIWVAILEYTPLRTIFATRDIPGAFSIVNLIIALVYNSILQQSLSSFETGPRMYQELLNAIVDLSSKFTQSVEVTVTKLSSNIIQDPVHRGLERERCLHTYELCKALVYFSLNLYSDAKDSIRGCYSVKVGDILRQSGMTAANKREYLPIFMNILLKEWFDEVTTAKNDGLLSAPDVLRLQESESLIRKRLQEFDTMRFIRAPSILSDIPRYVMYFYVLFILPVSMYDSVDKLMIVSYTIVVFLVFGPVFFNWWLGGPFDTHPRYTGMEYQKWRAAAYVEICQHQSLVRLDWMKKFPKDFRKEQHLAMSGGKYAIHKSMIQALEGRND
jgi:hypothetical protein